MWGRQIIDKGMRWRIGLGDKIKVFKSNWIPSYKSITVANLDMESTVADLIDDSQQWKDHLIH